MKKQTKLFMALGLALASTSAFATYMPKQAEASLLVKGTIEVAADGSVLRHSIDHPEKLDAGIIGMIDRSMTEWRFKPMHGPANATMSLVVRAKKTDDSKYRIWIGGADFEPVQDTARWTFATNTPPDYPREALMAGVGGKVYVYVHLDGEGKVVDAIAAQVDLGMIDKPVRMDHWRELLGDAAVAAARSWRLKPPSDASMVDSDAARTMTVPVEYFPDSVGLPKYGQWSLYLPGPRHAAPWLAGEAAFSQHDPEALAANGIYPMQHGELDLVTPLSAN